MFSFGTKRMLNQTLNLLWWREALHPITLAVCCSEYYQFSICQQIYRAWYSQKCDLLMLFPDYCVSVCRNTLHVCLIYQQQIKFYGVLFWQSGLKMHRPMCNTMSERVITQICSFIQFCDDFRYIFFYQFSVLQRTEIFPPSIRGMIMRVIL